MIFVGKFRVYFNRHNAAPLVWCVATDNWEIAVAGIAIRAEVRTVYEPKATADEDGGKPSAWLEVEGELEVVKNVAYIHPHPALAAPPARVSVGGCRICVSPATVVSADGLGYCKAHAPEEYSTP